MRHRYRFLTFVVAVATLTTVTARASYAEGTPTPSPSDTPAATPSASPSPTSSPATKQERLDEARRKLRDDQNGGLLKLLQQTDEIRHALEQALQQIRTQLDEAGKRLEESKAAQAIAKVDLARATAALRRARAVLARRRDILNEHAASLYMIGPAGFLPAVIGAANINDAMIAAEYGRYALRADSDAVNTFRAAAETVRRMQLDVAARKHSLDAQVRSAAAEQKALQELLARQNDIKYQLFGSMGQQAGMLSKVLNSSNPFGIVLASYSSATSGFTDVINEAQDGQAKAEFVEHWLTRPVPGRISSPYGWRVHPIYDYLSFHTGVDMSAEEGTMLRPSRAGRIIDAGYFGAFGLTVLIDHGNHIATVYAHLSRVFVEPGDTVTMKSDIGTVGSTGWSTGPHLHFEVRVNGKPQEPTHWF
jgi:murein DD-endopeptidase MepM/ murein hydrolase activator NlpD